MKRDLCLAEILRHHKNEIVAAVYGAAFDIMRLGKPPLTFVSFGAMGILSSQALGFALARPDKRVWVFDGDGSLLMNLGTLVTIGEVAPKNFIHFICENGTYEANGGHPIPGKGRVDFAAIAKASGYRNAYAFNDLDELKKKIGGILKEDGPTLVTLKIVPGEDSPMDWGYIHGPQSRKDFKAALAADRPH
ncbi:MAG: thiamine pyrophosphate-dependent enzyme [Pseudorhodoplanes sp.]